MKVSLLLRRVVSVLIACVMLPAVLLAAEPVSKSRLGGVAIGGHDSTAYHLLAASQEDVVKGVKSWVVKWKGAKWRFASKESSERFAAEPERFAPAFNGFCANALSLGKGLLRTDGTHWEIIGERLFLFYAAAGRERWVDAGATVSDYIQQAEAAWDKLR